MDLFLIAHIAGRGVAIPSEQVESVVDVTEIVAVPRADPAVRGLVALRSRVVTVIDTGIALGLPPTLADQTRAVITAIDGHHYAVLVDSLEDIAPFVRQPLASGMLPTDGWARCGTGLVEHDGEPLLIVDLTALVPDHAIAA